MTARKLVDREPDLDTFQEEVVAGLRSRPKYIPCKFFYDERGSQLFEEITRLKEYYPTRAELSILQTHVRDMAARLGPRCLLVEYGSGSSRKTRILLDELRDPAGYVPIDISKDHLVESARDLHERYPDLEIIPVCADYTNEIDVPATRIPPARRGVFFPGGTFGNFEPGDSEDFLHRLARLCGRAGGLLIGVDLKKDPRILELAYDDPRGVTAEFNLNLLERINRELGADFDVDQFRHRAHYDEEAGRIEMHLVSRVDQTVDVQGEKIEFERGETIWTENSYKYGIEEFHELATGCGFSVEKTWTDDRDLFSVHFLTVGD